MNILRFYIYKPHKEEMYILRKDFIIFFQHIEIKRFTSPDRFIAGPSYMERARPVEREQARPVERAAFSTEIPAIRINSVKIWLAITWKVFRPVYLNLGNNRSGPRHAGLKVIRLTDEPC